MLLLLSPGWALLAAGVSLLCLVPPATAGESSPDVPALKAKAEAGDLEAQFLLGRVLLRGEGAPKDLPEALRLLKPVAESGHAGAMGAYGFMLSRGLGTEKNESSAIEWLRKSAALGVATSQLNLGIMTLKGLGTPPNAAEGLALIEEAAKAGQPEAMVRLAEAWHFGEPGLPPDPAKAVIWAGQAAAAGNAQGQNLLGIMREHGLGVEKNDALAAEWYRKAAVQHHAKAQANLGRLLSNGRGVTMDRGEAWFWLRVSADAGEITAGNFLPEFKLGLSAAELEAAEKRIAAYQKERLSARLKKETAPSSSPP